MMMSWLSDFFSPPLGDGFAGGGSVFRPKENVVDDAGFTEAVSLPLFCPKENRPALALVLVFPGTDSNENGLVPTK